MIEFSSSIDHFIGRYMNSKVNFLKSLLGFNDSIAEKAPFRTQNVSRRVDEKERRASPRRINLIGKGSCSSMPDPRINRLPNAKLLNKSEEIHRSLYIPHIWINHSLIRPRYKSLVDHMGIEHWKILSLPGWISRLSWDDQVNKIRHTVQTHQRETGGYDEMFGNITDYIYCKGYGESYLFSIEGDLVIGGNENDEDN